MEDKINQIHELIKETCPDAVAVDVFVNERGIDFTPRYKTNVKDFTMRNISGNWVKRSR